MDQAEELRNVIKKQNQRTKKPARIITVTSGKGGVGKSNIAVNLAVQFQRMGLKTIIFIMTKKSRTSLRMDRRGLALFPAAPVLWD